MEKYKIGDMVECYKDSTKLGVGIVEDIENNAATVWHKILISYDSRYFTKDKRYTIGPSFKYKKIKNKAASILFGKIDGI